MTPANDAPITPERIMQFAWGYVPPLVLEAGIRHRIFDVLDAGPKTVSQVHEATGASVRGLSAVMNVLAGLNFLAKDAQDVYSLTPESSAFLVSTKPSFQEGRFLRRWLPVGRSPSQSFSWRRIAAARSQASSSR